MTEPIRVLVVDDELHARHKLRGFLESRPEVGGIEEAGDGIAAGEKIGSFRPDLVFLDIRMPGLSGIELASALEQGRAPQIIFTTAYDVYAAAAFNLDAVDYLLKPFDRARFSLAFDRALRRLAKAATPADFDRLREILGRLEDAIPRSGAEGARFLGVKSGNGIRFLPLRKISRIRADGDCVEIALGTERLRARERIGDLEIDLESRGFVRIHRSVLVNAPHVTEIRPARKGDQEVRLDNGERFVSSAAYKANVKDMIRRMCPVGKV